MPNSAEAWKAHELARLRAWRALSPAQRLEWLWQAKLFARRALAASARRAKR